MAEVWKDSLKAFLRPGAALVGIGNRLRGDDGLGPALADRVRGRAPWAVWDVGETPENALGRLITSRPAAVLLLDAVRWGAAPGAVCFFPCEEIPWGGVSTHALSLRLFADLLSSQTGCPVALLGLEPASTGLAAPLSAAVAESLDGVAEHLAALGVREARAQAGLGDGEGPPGAKLPGIPAWPAR